MATGGNEPVTQAIVNARDSAIGDRVIGAVAVLSLVVPLILIIGYFGYRPYPVVKVLGCFVFCGAATFFTYRFIQKVNKKRMLALELDLEAAKEIETQRQLAEMRAKNKLKERE